MRYGHMHRRKKSLGNFFAIQKSAIMRKGQHNNLNSDSVGSVRKLDPAMVSALFIGLGMFFLLISIAALLRWYSTDWIFLFCLIPGFLLIFIGAQPLFVANKKAKNKKLDEEK